MISINLSKQLLDIAFLEAKIRFEYGFRGPTVNDQYKFDMILISCIGELVIQDYLKSKSIPFHYVSDTFQGREIVIKDKLFEIKTSGYLYETRFLNFIYNVDQYEESQNKGIDYVIQILINGYDYKKRTFEISKCTNGIISGAIEYKKIRDLPIYHNVLRPNFKTQLNELVDINLIL